MPFRFGPTLAQRLLSENWSEMMEEDKIKGKDKSHRFGNAALMQTKQFKLVTEEQSHAAMCGIVIHYGV